MKFSDTPIEIRVMVLLILLALVAAVYSWWQQGLFYRCNFSPSMKGEWITFFDCPKITDTCVATCIKKNYPDSNCLEGCPEWRQKP